MAEFAAKRDLSGLKSIGITSQVNTHIFVDQAGQALTPAIIWQDGRCAEVAAALDAQISADDRIDWWGAPMPIDASHCLARMKWVADNEPEIWNKTKWVMLPKDYISFWLTGQLVSDMSDAAGTSWLDVGARAWSAELLAKTGMRRDQMHDLFEGTQSVGVLRADVAQDLGLPDGVQVIAGGGDNAAAACGVGALEEGDGFVSLGTSGVLLAARDRFAAAPESAVHTFCHAVPGRWYQMGVILAATDSLNWLSGIVGAPAADLTAALGTTLGPPGRERFLPYLSGERTPHNDSTVRGAFSGLDVSTSRDDMTRAVLEGVSYALKDSLLALQSTGANLPRLLAIGGGTASRYWVELLATVLDTPLDLPEQGELGAALGAARLAICGVTGADPQDIMTRPRVSETIDPNARLSAAYADAHAAFAASYPVLKAMP